MNLTDTNMELVDFKIGTVPKPIIKLGPKYISAFIDSGANVCLVNPKLLTDNAFKDASFPSQGSTTITVANKPYHLQDPYRVMLEVPEKGTAYMETVYVSPLPMPVDLIMNSGLPFSKDMNSLIANKPDGSATPVSSSTVLPN